MPIKLKYDSLKEIPAEDVRLYVEREGAWHLDADLKEERAKLSQLRSLLLQISVQMPGTLALDIKAHILSRNLLQRIVFQFDRHKSFHFFSSTIPDRKSVV